MVKEKGEVIKTAKHVIELFNQGNVTGLAQYLEKNLDLTTSYIRQRILDLDELVKLFHEKVTINGDVVHREYQLVIQTSIMAVVTGSYYFQRRTVNENNRQSLFYATLVFRTLDKKDTADCLKLKHLHLSAVSGGKRYPVRDIQERLHFINEEEILYLESRHNHVIWHCDNCSFESVGSLKYLQEILSESFLRIHRGFLINKLHVKCVERCQVVMDDGAVLQIPVKKYCLVKNELLKQI